MSEEITDRIKSFVIGILFPLALTSLAVMNMADDHTRIGNPAHTNPSLRLRTLALRLRSVHPRFLLPALRQPPSRQVRGHCPRRDFPCLRPLSTIQMKDPRPNKDAR